jgi:hypothetical protein
MTRLMRLKFLGLSNYKLRKESSEPTAWIAWTERTLSRVCWEETFCCHSFTAYSRVTKAAIIQRPNGDPFEDLPRELEDTFREFWTDNANRISMLYSGTGALKVDFTRYGKRSKAGEIEDGKRAVSRYFINNFYDVYNQNALDLVLGKIKHHELNGIARHSPTSTLGVALAVLFVHPDVRWTLLYL